MNDEDLETEAEPAARAPYEPPTIESETAFETMALSCSGNTPTSCPGPLLGS
jgi:hypothetical protein